ncbi:hypothetical protein Calow_0191 [Caldicellulosiruptor owensensis OL]|uniref:DUF2680 domain-containing protein n=1 Tax=Caldicellulosiruptor owensensis (strain ATCC 700167 / DSM 13100 / OL) TaxID=632518 RepID=E4Q2P3_CALOW|nr:DUF2680 domain-containing protein [Caldicellulosiruptor owensensis]ADQ03797.1 hypothetical protein Calow_0191 [Caldicellulosiruptor owensensis OL]
MKRRIGFVVAVALLVLALNLAAFAATSVSNTSSASATNTTALHMARGYGAQFMASVVSKLTGLTVDDVLKLKSQGQTFYQIALSKGVTVEKFKDAVYQQKAALVDQKVKDGIITKEQADAIKTQMKARIDSCNGQGYANRPQTGCGIFGGGNGQKQGSGQGRGSGYGRGKRGFTSGNSSGQSK